MTRSILILTLLASFSARASAGENWPDFRGPAMDGHSDAKDLPLEWSEQKSVRWKSAIVGRGWSTPVIWGEQIWLTTATSDGKELYALCVNKESGEVTQRIKVFEVDKPEPVNALNSYASPSPVIEAGKVYVHFGTYGTAAINTETGSILWKRTDLKLDHKEGPGSSPVLFENLLILTCDGADVQYTIALDTANGETKWKTKRSVNFGLFPGDFRKAYSTPIVAQVDGKPQLIATAAQSAYGYDLESGKELWRFGYGGFSNASRPVVGRGMMFLNSGYMKPQLFAIKLGGSGNITETNFVWKQTSSAPNKPSPLLIDDHLYLVSDGGVASCLDTKTGEPVWTKRLGGSFSASPIHAAGRIYISDQDGKTFVFQTGSEYQQLAVNKLDEGCMASPAVSMQAIFLRTKTCLYRIEESAK
ncbi:MAG: PQQ-like beta-propeller repeat protein [Pirellulaceae bacterium]|nr:PQQ-like beta-propeller repeat protein [Pirellulaceae bacterium]